ncbi:MAG: hypothetical protein K940chlam7_00960 [Chlamydiae bacterium]|nr:hypothetical protein [Chlamydiota bacterium]
MSKKVVTSLFILTAVLSTIWVCLVPNEPISDQIIYHQRSAAMAAGQGLYNDDAHINMFWAPGYSIYLAAFYLIGGNHYYIAFLANIICYIALVMGTFALTQKIYSTSVARVAAVAVAIYPGFLFYTTIFASELLFTALIVWAAYFSWRSFDEDHPWNRKTVISGFLYGAATLVRPQALIMGLLLPVLAWTHSKKLRQGVVRAVIVTAMVLTVCLPWGYRNYHKFGSYVLVSANFGHNLWMGNNPNSTEGYNKIDDVVDGINIKNMGQLERDHFLRKKALEYISQHPWEYFKLILKRFYIAMKSESISVTWNKIGITNGLSEAAYLPLKISANLIYYLVMGTFLISIISKIKEKTFQRKDIFLCCSIVILSVPFLLIQAQDRFHLPLIPFVIMIAASKLSKFYSFS